MNEEIDDQDFFQHDFTTQTEWEIFIAHLEKVIHDWKLAKIKRGHVLKKRELSEGEWKRNSETIQFADVEFKIIRNWLESEPVEDVSSPVDEETDQGKLQVHDDIMSVDNDFPPQTESSLGDGFAHPHPLARLYGLRDFVIVAPARDAISSESKVKILLSSVCMAINNSNCPVPFFVQIHEPHLHYYMGICEGKGIQTQFEMIHLKRTPPHCKYLTGLLNLFKTKIASPLPLEPVSVAVRFTYILRDWTSNYTWTQEPPDFDFFHGESLGVAELGKLPFGATFDPISELHLFATWPQLMENVVVDSESYSDFEPSQAPQWSIGVKMVEQPTCLLSECLSEFIDICSSNRSMQDLLGDFVDRGNLGGTNLSTPLNVLTESRVPTISKVIKRAKGQPRRDSSPEGPISENLLMPILYFLFPDAEDQPKSPYPEVFSNHSSYDNRQTEEMANGLKSAPVDGLVWRLAVVMSHVVHTRGGVKAAAHLWYEFTQEMRFRWEKGILVPGVAHGFPDPRTCLLHQKLQMLNCCMERKKAREQAARAGSMEIDEIDTDSEDDEFFDAADEPLGDSKDERRGSRHRHKHSLWNQPVGRLSKHGNLRLLKTGEHLYIPITQEPSPKTEDQVEEDAEVLLQLGTDAQGAEMRARMMSASLLSDMESFKAANPGAILEDFIRWYSPRDWIEENEVDEYGQKKVYEKLKNAFVWNCPFHSSSGVVFDCYVHVDIGSYTQAAREREHCRSHSADPDVLVEGSLSARMQIKGNMWVDVWEAAKPVPARRQKRLFDDTREAEKVLHYLESQKPSGFADLLLPALTHAAICRLLEEQKEELTMLPDAFKCIIKIAERVTRNPKPSIRHYKDLAQEIVNTEAIIAQANSLEHKFCCEAPQTPEMKSFLSQVMNLPEVDVPGGPRGVIGTKIRTMFSDAQKAVQMLMDSEIVNVGEEPPWTNSTSNFPQPSTKEFIMRVMAARPSPSSCITPQRLTAVLEKKEFRLAGCFSHDTTFH